MYSALRALLFRLEPETAHSLTLGMMRLVGKVSILRRSIRALYYSPPKPVNVFGLNFMNPIGLAAGYDKDGIGWRGLACLGFGHIELGTVTPHPQPGNPKPRLFRLPSERGLINRLGFPGRGAEFAAGQLSGPRPSQVVLGVNLGKNALTPLESAVSDYISLLNTFANLADYLVVNVSSPNTVGLRRLQARDSLQELLAALDRERRSLGEPGKAPIPILVKLSPDLNDRELDDALEVILAVGMEGVIATNTTISREGIGRSSKHSAETGGLSGVPLRDRSTKMINEIFQRTGGKLPIIGVGGVMNAGDAREKLDAGATLVQLYTGLVYRGPGLVKQILTDL